MFLPHTIVLGGGGVKAVAHIGALTVLEKAGHLRLCRHYVGLSAGALVAFGLCLGYPLPTLHDLCERFDFAALQDPAPEGILSFLDNYGIDTGERLSKFLAALLTIRGYPSNITFGGLKTHGAPKRLTVVATNMTTGRPAIFNAELTPDFKVIDALRASMGIPFYFWPVRSPQGILVDGGIHALYPMNMLSAEERAKALGIVLMPDLTENWIDDGPDSYVMRLYELASTTKTGILYEMFKERTIRVITPAIRLTQFSLSAEQRHTLYRAGYESAQLYIKEHCSTIRRRKSI
jgi:predicted acylesterase/phospholipase RssA